MNFFNYQTRSELEPIPFSLKKTKKETVTVKLQNGVA